MKKEVCDVLDNLPVGHTPATQLEDGARYYPNLQVAAAHLNSLVVRSYHTTAYDPAKQASFVFAILFYQR